MLQAEAVEEARKIAPLVALFAQRMTEEHCMVLGCLKLYGTADAENDGTGWRPLAFIGWYEDDDESEAMTIPLEASVLDANAEERFGIAAFLRRCHEQVAL